MDSPTTHIFIALIVLFIKAFVVVLAIAGVCWVIFAIWLFITTLIP